MSDNNTVLLLLVLQYVSVQTINATYWMWDVAHWLSYSRKGPSKSGLNVWSK